MRSYLILSSLAAIPQIFPSVHAAATHLKAIEIPDDPTVETYSADLHERDEDNIGHVFVPVYGGPLERRDTDPGKVQPQMDNAFGVLSKIKDSKIDPRTKKQKDVIKELNALLTQEGKDDKFVKDPKDPKNTDERTAGNLRILFVEFAGTKGDIGKSMFYVDVLEDLRLQANLWSRLMKKLKTIFPGTSKAPQVDLRLVMDCEYEDYLPASIKKDYKLDIEACGKDLAGFKAAIKKQMTVFDPHIVVLGHAVAKIYNSNNKNNPDWVKKQDQSFKEITQPIDEKCDPKKDGCVKVAIKSYFKQVQSAQMKEDYQLGPNDVTIVGQTADWFPEAMPDKSLQIRVGRADTPGMGEVPADLKKWLGDAKQKKVMYLGHGGLMRPVEKDIEKATPLIKDFVEERLKDENDNDWSFIIFHNIKNPDPTKDLVTDEGRVYHLYYGTNLFTLWGDKKIKIVMHHCGKGSFDDAILAGKAQLCMPQAGFGADMEDWANELNVHKLGVGLADKKQWVEFIQPMTDLEQYQGEQKPYSTENQKKLLEAFRELEKEMDTIPKTTVKHADALKADTAADLTEEIIQRFSLGLMKRREKPKP